MRRRALLRSVGSGSVLGVAVSSGCLEESGEEEPIPEQSGNRTVTTGHDGCAIEGSEFDVAEWEHDVGGTVAAVSNGRAFGTEHWVSDGAVGGVFALDAATGERLWTYGETGGYTSYTTPVVEDALYFGEGDDAIGSGTGSLYALEFDGEERWTHDVGSVYSRPIVADCIVYVGSDDGVVRAFDTVDGELLWSTDEVGDEGPQDVSVVAVTDVVYVLAGNLVALDRDDGSVIWEYGDVGDRIRGATVVDGVAYVTNYDRVAAVSGGRELWRKEFGTNKWIRGVEGGSVFVEHSATLQTFDAEDGTEGWTVDGTDNITVDFHDGRVFVGEVPLRDSDAADARLRTLDADDGTEIWARAVGGGGRVQSVDVAPGDGSGYSVYAHTNDTEIYRLDPDGEERWSGSVEGRIRNYELDRHLFVGTMAGIFSLEPR